MFTIKILKTKSYFHPTNKSSKFNLDSEPSSQIHRNPRNIITKTEKKHNSMQRKIQLSSKESSVLKKISKNSKTHLTKPSGSSSSEAYDQLLLKFSTKPQKSPIQDPQKEKLMKAIRNSSDFESTASNVKILFQKSSLIKVMF